MKVVLISQRCSHLLAGTIPQMGVEIGFAGHRLRFPKPDPNRLTLGRRTTLHCRSFCHHPGTGSPSCTLPRESGMWQVQSN